MSWAIGLTLIMVSFIVIAIVAIAIDEMGGPDDTDHVAEQKRRNHHRATKAAGELRHHR